MAESKLNFNESGSVQTLNDLVKETNDIKDIFDEIEFMVEAINGEEEVWKGKSQESFYDSFKTISGKFKEIGENLDRQNEFLDGTIANYKEREAKINRNAEEKADDLNIN